MQCCLRHMPHLHRRRLKAPPDDTAAPDGSWPPHLAPFGLWLLRRCSFWAEAGSGSPWPASRGRWARCSSTIRTSGHRCAACAAHSSYASQRGAYSRLPSALCSATARCSRSSSLSASSSSSCCSKAQPHLRPPFRTATSSSGNCRSQRPQVHNLSPCTRPRAAIDPPAPRPTPHAPRPTPHAPRPTTHDPRPTTHAPVEPGRDLAARRSLPWRASPWGCSARCIGTRTRRVSWARCSSRPLARM